MYYMGMQIPNRKGQFSGVIWDIQFRCSRRSAAAARICCKRDHSINNNVMQQKGSFTMPGKRKEEFGKF